MKRTTGNYITISNVGERCQAFIPDPLPPKPELLIDGNLRELLDQTLLALGRLDSSTLFLPETDIFLYMYIRKEAVLSSQIEGTQSSLSELLLFEIGGKPDVSIDDVQEVSNYVAALNHGLKLVREGLPISLRLFREMHQVLLSKGRGSDKMPGEFRTSQNWIGGTRPGNATHVPPPPDKLLECMGQLEKFINDVPEKTPTLIKAALTHAQFETIHPFLDGNGRVGRLLITILLCSEAILKEPLLYLSLYFKTHRATYYDLLQQIRVTGNWESWIEFFLTAVKETAEKAITTASELINLAEEDKRKIQQIGRSSGSALRVHEAFLQRPIISIPKICETTGLWTTSVTTVIKHFEKLGIIKEITGRKRNRLYRYSKYIEVLNEGTDVTV
ncbi:MAG: Fic family protein [Planctomycetota bacterium]